MGEVAYRLALPPQMSHIHNVFHVSLLHGYNYNPLHVIDYRLEQIESDLSYKEEPERIIGRTTKKLRNRSIPHIKVLWKNQDFREATWEREESFKNEYPDFYKNCKSSNLILDFEDEILF